MSVSFLCTAVSELSDASVGETSPPKFTQLLRDLTVKSGQRVCLQCRVTGHPLPTVQWFRDNKVLESSPDFQVSYLPLGYLPLGYLPLRFPRALTSAGTMNCCCCGF